MDMQPGSRLLKIFDHTCGIEFPVLVMYPSNESSGIAVIHSSPVKTARDAPVKDGLFPLVVISHGGGGNYLGYLTIASYLVNSGCVVAMPEHYKNNRNNNELADTVKNLENRPRHITQVIDAVCSDSRLGSHIQDSRVAVIGHSMGGYTALAVAGGKPWSSDRQKIHVKPDSRVAAIVLLAPAALFFIPEGALLNVDVPVLLLNAQKDTVTTQAHAAVILKHLALKESVDFETVANAGHFSFLSPFPKSLKYSKYPPALDPPGFDRETFHRYLNSRIGSFLEKNIRL